MNENASRRVIAILADLPLWTLPGMENLCVPSRHYATWLEPLVPEFEKEGDLEIHWITVSKHVKERRTFEAFGQTVHALPRGSKMVSMVTGYLREILAIRKVLRKLQPHLVHAWGSEDVYGLAGGFAPTRNRLFTLQGCLTDLRFHGGGHWLFRLQASYEKPTIRRYARGTAESPRARDSLRRLHPAMNVGLVDYGVHPGFFDVAWDPAPSPEVLFLGSVTRLKGIADLIEVAKSPKHADVRFTIIGDGDLLPTLRADSPPNVEWTGKLDRGEVMARMAKAWCLALPTYADTGPTAVKEARVMGLPVLTTTAAGASCHVEHGVSGFVVAPGDLGAMSEALSALCGSRESCLRMGRARAEDLRRELHPRATAQKFASLYREMCQPPRASTAEEFHP